MIVICWWTCKLPSTVCIVIQTHSAARDLTCPLLRARKAWSRTWNVGVGDYTFSLNDSGDEMFNMNVWEWSKKIIITVTCCWIHTCPGGCSPPVRLHSPSSWWRRSARCSSWPSRLGFSSLTAAGPCKQNSSSWTLSEWTSEASDTSDIHWAGASVWCPQRGLDNPRPERFGVHSAPTRCRPLARLLVEEHLPGGEKL